MPKEIDTSPDARWKQRFRAWTIAAASVASREPTRGMAVTNRSGVQQVYAWDIPSGELRQLTDAPAGKLRAVLSPDGEFVYHLDDTKGNEIGHLVRVPFRGGEPEDVTPDLAPYALSDLALSRDGSRLALATASREGFVTLLFELGPAGELGPNKQLFHTARLMRGLHLSNDGSVAVLGLTERSKSTDVALVAVDTKTGERINELFDEGASVTAARFSRVPGDDRVLCTTTRSGDRRPLIWEPRSGKRADLPLEDVQGEVLAADWSEDGERLLLIQVNNAVQRLGVLELQSGEVRWLEHPPGVIAGAHFAPDRALYVLMSDSTTPMRIVSLDEATGQERKVLLRGGDAPAATKWRSVSYPSTKGATIQAWLATPPGNGPFPTILNVHGGPTAAAMDQFAPLTESWLDHGFAYLSINFRGSTTFGREFEKSILGDLGHWEVDDMGAAYEWLVKSDIADPSQVFLMGGSYGGYLTLLGLGKLPDLWAGGMATVAIADWRLMYEDQAETLRQYQVALFGGTPDELPEQHARSSPITFADRVRAPLLVIQGANDTRCPARQMHAYEERMRELGKEFRLHWFEAGHGSYAIEQAIEHQQMRLEFAFNILAGNETAPK